MIKDEAASSYIRWFVGNRHVMTDPEKLIQELLDRAQESEYFSGQEVEAFIRREVMKCHKKNLKTYHDIMGGCF